jgi:hypothetical protein
MALPITPSGRPVVDLDGPGARRVAPLPGSGVATRTRYPADLHKRPAVAGSARRPTRPETAAGGPR